MRSHVFLQHPGLVPGSETVLTPERGGDEDDVSERPEGVLMQGLTVRGSQH